MASRTPLPRYGARRAGLRYRLCRPREFAMLSLGASCTAKHPIPASLGLWQCRTRELAILQRIPSPATPPRDPPLLPSCPSSAAWQPLPPTMPPWGPRTLHETKSISWTLIGNQEIHTLTSYTCLTEHGVESVNITQVNSRSNLISSLNSRYILNLHISCLFLEHNKYFITSFANKIINNDPLI